MTKFEEVLNKVIFNGVAPRTNEKFYLKSTLLRVFSNWHSDEEFHELLDKYSNLNDNYEKEVIRSSKIESQIIDLKSQLQQQALPVVPECVGELFNEYRFENIQRLFEFGIDDIKSNKMIKALMWRDKHPDTFSLAFITGKYEVEKPQLFYLKHIDMSKHSRYFDFYLEYDGNESMEHKRVDKGEKPGTGYEKSCYTFTQQEIDSMQTGSYEQIEVEK